MRKWSRVIGSILMMMTCLGLASCGRGEDIVSNNNATDSVINLEEDSFMQYDFTDKAMSYIDYISKNLRNREAGNNKSDHPEAVAWIVSELKAAGYEESQIVLDEGTAVSDMTGIQSDYTNIVVAVPGNNHDKQIIVGAHYDGDGLGDNGSGFALLLANATGLYGITPEYDVKYVFFDAEEVGLIGSEAYASKLTDEEIAKTMYMVNLDALLFGDYCNVYGGITDIETGQVLNTEAYELACDKATYMGIEVWNTKRIDGYYAEHGTGPEIKTNTIYTSPWTANNPAPNQPEVLHEYIAYSPSTIPASDHVGFAYRGIPIIYFEATNWYVGNVEGDGFDGYYETYDTTIGEHGMFMNTKYDTLKNLNKYFPGRAQEHFTVYSRLLSSLVLNPESETVVK